MEFDIDFWEPDVARETAPIFPIVVDVGDCTIAFGVVGVPGVLGIVTDELVEEGKAIGFNFIVGVFILESAFDAELERL